MTSRGSYKERRRHGRPGFSLLEVAISTLIVGVLLVGALNAVGQATVGQVENGDKGRAYQLAGDLMSEILGQDYLEPDDVSSGLGRESGESGGDRTDYDDVDDYDGWSSSPPEERDGTALANLSGWQRSVVVRYANPSNVSANAVSDLGVKAITVTVTHNGRELAVLTAVATEAGQRQHFD